MLRTILVLGVLELSLTCSAVAAKGPSNPNGNPNNTLNNNNNNTNTNNGNNGNNKPSLAYPPPVDTAPAQEDRKKLDEARAAQAKAQAHFNEVIARLKTAFESAPEHKATVIDAQKAQSTYDVNRERVLAGVRQSADYKSATAARDDLTARLNSTSDDAERPQIAQQRLEASKKLTALEVAAMESDPQAIEARQTLSVAAAKSMAQLQEFQQSIRTNADWQAAKTDLDKARADMVAADKTLNAELAQEAQAQKDRAAQVAQIDRQRLEQSGKGAGRTAPY